MRNYIVYMSYYAPLLSNYFLSFTDKYEIRRDELHIFRELGSGQFGVVHLAKHIKLDKFVAIKTMKPNAMSEDEFIQEAKNMKYSSHSSLILFSI